jgi:hypothetical protein
VRLLSAASFIDERPSGHGALGNGLRDLEERVVEPVAKVFGRVHGRHQRERYNQVPELATHRPSVAASY